MSETNFEVGDIVAFKKPKRGIPSKVYSLDTGTLLEVVEVTKIALGTFLNVKEVKTGGEYWGMDSSRVALLSDREEVPQKPLKSDKTFKGKFIESTNQKGYVYITTSYGVYRLTPSYINKDYKNNKETRVPDEITLVATFGE